MDLITVDVTGVPETLAHRGGWVEVIGDRVTVDDLKRDGMLHAAILRSSVAHGRLKSVDTSAALMVKGVRAIITAKDMPGGPPISQACGMRPLL